MMINYGSRLGVLLLLSSSVVVNSAPPRIFGNKNVLMKETTDGSPMEEPLHDEEEMELESLKKGHDIADVNPGTNSNVIHTAQSKKLSSISTSTPMGIEYVKKPVNEETPAISDNANSLKFSSKDLNRDGLASLLYAKKSHIGHDVGVNDQSKQPLHHFPRTTNIYEQHDPINEMLRNPNGGSVGGLGSITKEDPLNLQLDYTPQDIAEYIFWTRDEHGVAMAIGDFLQDGLVGREEAVRFLEDVKKELNSIRSRYTSSVAQGQFQDGPNLLNGYSNTNNNIHGLGSGLSSKLGDILQTKRDEGFLFPEISSSLPYSESSRNPNGAGGGGGGVSIEDLDYEEITDKLRTVDAKMREYSLEEIIYQLAKDLFSESFKNSPSDSIQKFSSFIESQAANGRIPKDLEKDVLDALIGALVDAVDEHGVQIQGQQQGQENVSKIDKEHVHPPQQQPTQSQAALLAGLKKIKK